jgi:hypothetical protein
MVYRSSAGGSRCDPSGFMVTQCGDRVGRIGHARGRTDRLIWRGTDGRTGQQLGSSRKGMKTYSTSYSLLLPRAPRSSDAGALSGLCDKLKYVSSARCGTHSFAADRVFPDCRGAPAARRPSPLTVGLIEGHGTG